MEAGLRPFGTDFGNAEDDRRFFQVDALRERYRQARREVPTARRSLVERRPAARTRLTAVADWMRARLTAEHPDLPLREHAASDDPESGLTAIADHVQEDFAILGRDPDSGDEAAIALFVAFPSGWRPERLLGASFRAIHGPVPGFADGAAQARSMVASMLERGPYVRFVWTVSADDHLDHHPDGGRRDAWTADNPGWLRVERQVTVPFAASESSLFLIRTHLYRFDALTRPERETLARALAALPGEIARYKGLATPVRELAIARLLDPDSRLPR